MSPSYASDDSLHTINHCLVGAYQRQFNSKLARLFDQTIPQLGYIPHGKLPADPKRMSRWEPGAGAGGAISLSPEDQAMSA